MSEGALRQMERGLSMRALRRALAAGDDERSFGENDPNGFCRNAGQVGHDLDGACGLDHVHGRPVFDGFAVAEGAKGVEVSPIEEDSRHGVVHSNPVLGLCAKSHRCRKLWLFLRSWLYMSVIH